MVFSPSYLLFFGTAFFFVLMHELSHSLVAKTAGIPVERITLTPIGGIASVEVPAKPWIELAMSIAGPLFNLLVVGVCLLLINFMGLDLVGYVDLLGAGELEFGMPYMLFTVLYINLILGLFNILPGFPMDGGRILRSVLALFMDYVKATSIAVSFGRYFIFPLMFVAGLFSGNMFLVFIAIILYLAGGQELKFTQMRAVFSKVKVADVMAPKPSPVEASETLLSFLSNPSNLNQRFHVVSGEGGKVLGVLDLSTLQGVDLNSASSLVSDHASKDFGVVSASDEVGSQLKTLLSRNYVLVVSGGRVVGHITPQIMASRMPLFAIRKKN